MVEDVYDKVASLDLVEAVLVVPDDDADPARDLDEVVWPGTPVLRLAGAAGSSTTLDAIQRLGADEAVLVTGDAPDVPGLLLGKLHRALGSAAAAVLPARDGGLVALAAVCPVAEWVLAAGAGLDVPDALSRLQQAAPRRSAVSVGPGWHRVRRPADLSLLDQGLEGWDVTRAWLREQSSVG